MPRSRKRNRWPNQYETKSPVTAPTIATTMIGIMGMPAIAPAAATAIRIGVPGTTIPRTATASTMAATKAIRIASIGYCAARSAAPLISDHMLRLFRRCQHHRKLSLSYYHRDYASIT
jgi:hypothetical protein